MAVRGWTSWRLSSGRILRATFTLGPAMWQCMSMPPGMTTRPSASSRRASGGHVGHDLAVRNPDVAHLAVDAVRRIVDAAVDDAQHGGSRLCGDTGGHGERGTRFPPSSSRTRSRIRVSTSSSLG